MNGPIKDTQEAITSRIGTPFTGTFILGWLICNWPVLLFTFTGDDRSFLRVELIKQYFNETSLLHLLVIPMVMWVFYLFAVPKAIDWYERFPRDYKKKRLFRDAHSLTEANEIHLYGSELREICTHLLKKNDEYWSLLTEALKEYSRNGEATQSRMNKVIADIERDRTRFAKVRANIPDSIDPSITKLGNRLIRDKDLF